MCIFEFVDVCGWNRIEDDGWRRRVVVGERGGRLGIRRSGLGEERIEGRRAWRGGADGRSGEHDV